MREGLLNGVRVQFLFGLSFFFFFFLGGGGGVHIWGLGFGFQASILLGAGFRVLVGVEAHQTLHMATVSFFRVFMYMCILLYIHVYLCLYYFSFQPSVHPSNPCTCCYA